MISQTGGYPPNDDGSGGSAGLALIALIGAVAGLLVGYIFTESLAFGIFLGAPVGALVLVACAIIVSNLTSKGG